jgi:hypothetical protein
MDVSGRTLRCVRTWWRRHLSVPLSAVALAIGASGCHRSEPRPSLDADAGHAPDALDPLRDTDFDGLCDPHELSRGLRVDDPDSDGDGYSDLAEVSLGFNPLLPSSPDRDRIVLLSEGSTARATVTVTVRGAGEDYYGAFQVARQVYEDGGSAADFFTSAAAVGASPMTNVFSIEGQRFRRVIGRTALFFEVAFALPDDPRDCIRAYPFQYTVKRDGDGRIVALERFTLVVAPEGLRPGAGRWCAPDPCY